MFFSNKNSIKFLNIFLITKIFAKIYVIDIKKYLILIISNCLKEKNINFPKNKKRKKNFSEKFMEKVFYVTKY